MSFLSVILIIGVVFLTGITIVLVRNLFFFRGLTQIPPVTGSHASVAVCIPARNEEKVIGRCLESVLNQNYPNYMVYVLNDRSTDNTHEVVKSFRKKYPDKLTFIEGRGKPEGWLGKNWACQQLGEQALEEFILFIDADTWLEPDTLSKLTGAFAITGADFITVWPQQHLKSFSEKIVVPLVYYALLGLLPVHYLQRKPRWMPASIYNKYKHYFAAACGQFMAFKDNAYKSIGGHKQVSYEVVEDVNLARLILKSGFKMRMYHGVHSVHCRMYESAREMYNGFRKNFLAGFNDNILLFMLMGVLHFITFLLPAAVLIASFFTFIHWTVGIPALIGFTLMVINRFLLAFKLGWSIPYAFLHPLGVLWFQYLGLVVLFDRYMENPVYWKGEQVNEDVMG